MKRFRNEINNIMRAVTVLTAIFTMTFVWAGSASAVVVGPLGDPTVIQAPIGTGLNPFGVRPAFVNPPVASQAFVRPPIVNSSFVSPPFFNTFVRPPIFSPFFRPFFNPFLNPFFGADVDLPFAGVGIGAVD